MRVVEKAEMLLVLHYKYSVTCASKAQVAWSNSLSRKTTLYIAVSEALCLLYRMSVMCRVCSLGLLTLHFISCVGMLPKIINNSYTVLVNRAFFIFSC